MDITIAASGMPFGPETTKVKSLGGSESAALSLARELRARDHSVTLFCHLPPPGESDHWPSGKIAEDGVRYVDVSNFQQHTGTNDCDLSIIVRSPELAAMHTLARKKVLWMHDIATKRGMGRAFDGMQFAIDEVWTVSEWHRQQVHKATGYPLEFIIAMRNGILKQEVVKPPARDEKTIIYAARPERGLDNLIRPNGVMDNLPEYNLKVAMYDHFPEHMREYYEQIFARMKEMPNVEYIGGKSNGELRQLMAECAAYIYPTQFEETSCILARECIEQQTPFFTTRTGALPETLGDCAVFFEDYLAELGYVEPEKGSVAWCKLFAQFFREGMAFDQVRQGMAMNQSARDDLYWDGVADMVEQRLPDNAKLKPFSVAWSMIQDGDVIAAKAFLEQQEYDTDLRSEFLLSLYNEVTKEYPFLLDPEEDGYMSLKDYYEKIYSSKKGTQLSELHFFDTLDNNNRILAIAEMLSEMPHGQKVVEFGCGPGHLLATLAKKFPQHDFFGIEISPSAVECLNNGAQERGYTNLKAVQGDEKVARKFAKQFDVSICSEVLEHVHEPWKTAKVVEGMVKPGGTVIFTVPFGPWEPITLNQKGKWHERAHIWLLDRKALRSMFQNKPDKRLLVSINQQPEVNHSRVTGNFIVSYAADHEPIGKIDVPNKWQTHHARQTTAACMIAYNNEDTILRCLNSLRTQVQIIQIALGPATDKTREIIEQFAADHPQIRVRIIDAPKIEPYKFGFDDARNLSVEGLEDVVDWILWIDTDEYLSGDFTAFLRPNCLDAYVIPQHHFTVEPRGAPAQVDRPARLIRTDRGYKAIGHIHEHFEVPEGGPGRAWELPNVDIGHTGYVNEQVRQGRFHRNLEFLKWDNEQPDRRKLHRFLWFRDMIHIMREYIREGRPDMAVQVAQAAVSYYNEHWAVISGFGPGFIMGQQYLNEAYHVLNRGVPVQITVNFGDRQAQIASRFEEYEQIERLFKFLVEPELKDRNDRYF